ncbi:triose-phosphate transporter family-domain-containing protein [Phlyctochytrium arcticum]|nr:triose-phosphate transporter family-domain-containing protein [Phlyctochytrium arcticum]
MLAGNTVHLETFILGQDRQAPHRQDLSLKHPRASSELHGNTLDPIMPNINYAPRTPTVKIPSTPYSTDPSGEYKEGHPSPLPVTRSVPSPSPVGKSSVLPVKSLPYRHHPESKTGIDGRHSPSPYPPSPLLKPSPASPRNVNINITYSTSFPADSSQAAEALRSQQSSPSKHHPSTSSSAWTRAKQSLFPQAKISQTTLQFCGFCAMWYASSALTNNSGKQILNYFPYPVTLTFIQFAFVSGLCLLASRAKLVGKIQRPSRKVIGSVIPLAGFQIAGHVFSSMAISRVPVSFAHTIKALSPLFTVLLYRTLFKIKYGPKVYLSLLPLTLGVMLVCMSGLSFNFVGFLCALVSTLIFVVQNIVSKKIFNENGVGAAAAAAQDVGHHPHSNHDNVPPPPPRNGGGEKKLDKTTVLFYSAGLAFCLMVPLWLYSDGRALFGKSPKSSIPVLTLHPRLPLLFLLNGTTHFLQNVLAFHILSLVSPVTYSIASLVKRIFVISAAIVWFAQPVDRRQAFGIGLTFLGLWIYQDAKREVDKNEERIAMQAMSFREFGGRSAPAPRRSGGGLSGVLGRVVGSGGDNGPILPVVRKRTGPAW